MTKTEIQAAFNEHFGKQPGFNQKTSDEVAHHLAAAIAATGVATTPHPTAEQQACYAKCEQTKKDALVACALKGFPGALICGSAAVLAFNTCRHQCDQGGAKPAGGGTAKH